MAFDTLIRLHEDWNKHIAYKYEHFLQHFPQFQPISHTYLLVTAPQLVMVGSPDVSAEDVCNAVTSLRTHKMRVGQTVIGLDKLSEQSGVCSLPEHWCAWDKNILSKEFRRKRKVARQHLLTSGINFPPLGIITDNPIILDRSLSFDWNYTNSHCKSSEIEPNVTLGWLSSCQFSDSIPSISVGWCTECTVKTRRQQQLSSRLISFTQ